MASALSSRASNMAHGLCSRVVGGSELENAEKCATGGHEGGEMHGGRGRGVRRRRAVSLGPGRRTSRRRVGGRGELGGEEKSALLLSSRHADRQIGASGESTHVTTRRCAEDRRRRPDEVGRRPPRHQRRARALRARRPLRRHHRGSRRERKDRIQRSKGSTERERTHRCARDDGRRHVDAARHLRRRDG